ncbi:MAG: phage holin family protein, partial [Patescibacteria group bacterium]
MRFIFKLILQILANALGIFVAVYFIDQIIFTGNWLDYLIVGAILAVANLIIRPILKVITAPLIFITLGLFVIVINVIILFGVDWFVEELIITNLWGYLWGSIIIS